MASSSILLSFLVLTSVLGLTVGSLNGEDSLKYQRQSQGKPPRSDIRREIKKGLREEIWSDKSYTQWINKIVELYQGGSLVERCIENEDNTEAFCGGQNVTEIPQNLNKTIEYISFFETGIEIIPPDILGNYRNLKTIHFFRNNIKEISPKAFEGLFDLEVLFLNNNMLRDDTFGSDTFEDLTSLKYLVLDENVLTKVPKNFLTAIPGLLQLGLDFNKIDEMGLELTTSLQNLTHLHISFNKFSSLNQSTFQHMPKLKYLCLNHNSISIIRKGALKELDNLEHFEATNMITKLTVEDDAFNRNLKFLDLSGNLNMNISTFALMTAPALEEVSLEHSDISNLDGAAFMYKPHLKKLKIGSNPFVCDCQAAWMANARVEAKPWALDWDINGTSASPVCYSPSWMQNKTISNLYPQDLTCHKPYIEALTPTFTQLDKSRKTIFKARLTNGLPQATWVSPDRDILGGKRQLRSVSDTIVDSDHSVITQYEVDEGFDKTGLVNFTLTAYNVAGGSSLIFWLFNEPCPSGSNGRPPVVTIRILILLMLALHYMK